MSESATAGGGRATGGLVGGAAPPMRSFGGASTPRPPAWACTLAGTASRVVCVPVRQYSTGKLEVSVAEGDVASLATARWRSARSLHHAADFRRGAADMYRAVGSALEGGAHRHVVRMWNHIPGIHDRMSDGGAAAESEDCDRYMLFNAGRFEVMCEWFAGVKHIPALVPAASGIGDGGEDLVVHALALGDPGSPIENPYQIPAFRYSRRYGPLPPCFARATRIVLPSGSGRDCARRAALLIAGTAAITGEDSRFNGDLARQWKLTLDNLRVLIRAGLSPALAPGDAPDAPDARPGNDPLERMRHVRIYVKHAQDFADVAAHASAAFPQVLPEELELLRADLCRTELLVEIEGVAVLD